MSERLALEIVDAVAEEFGYTLQDVLKRDRHKGVCLVRHISAYCCRRRLGLSFPELGKVFDNRDHTTMLHAVRKIADGLFEDCPGYVKAVLRAETALEKPLLRVV